MVDADGATKFSDLQHVDKALDDLKGGKNGMAVCVGSRAHLQEDAIAQVSNTIINFLHFPTVKRFNIPKSFVVLIFLNDLV